MRLRDWFKHNTVKPTDPATSGIQDPVFVHRFFVEAATADLQLVQKVIGEILAAR